jgi:hypothetical protein
MLSGINHSGQVIVNAKAKVAVNYSLKSFCAMHKALVILHQSIDRHRVGGCKVRQFKSRSEHLLPDAFFPRSLFRLAPLARIKTSAPFPALSPAQPCSAQMDPAPGGHRRAGASGARDPRWMRCAQGLVRLP